MKTVIEMAREAGASRYTSRHFPDRPTHTFTVEQLQRFAELVRADEREACQALQQHEDVLAPVGNSAWGEAYQEGWAAGTAAYLEAIRARSTP